ncbi:MAG: HdeA/HdeB family chaperone [Pseudomonadota bacterium]
MMHYLTTTVLALALLGLSGLGLPGAAIAQDDETTIDISETTCQMFLEVDGDEAHDILIFHHGYLLGMRGETIIDVEELGEMSDEITDTCTDNPDLLLLELFNSFEQL